MTQTTKSFRSLFPARVPRVGKTNWGSILKKVAGIAFTLWAASKKSSGTPVKNSDQPSQSTSKSAPKKARQSSKSQSPKPGPGKKHVNVDRVTNTVGDGSGQHKAPQAPVKTRTNDDSGYVAPALSSQYPGDFSGALHPEYSPSLDGDADPGEIVWTWVPYEEDYNQGKDRPVLIVGRDGGWLLGLMLSSKDHTGNGSRYGDWLDIGAGPWDSQGRDSEIRLDRAIRINPDSMRREGAIMNRDTFIKVVKRLPFDKV